MQTVLAFMRFHVLDVSCHVVLLVSPSCTFRVHFKVSNLIAVGLFSFCVQLSFSALSVDDAFFFFMQIGFLVYFEISKRLKLYV